MKKLRYDFPLIGGLLLLFLVAVAAEQPATTKIVLLGTGNIRPSPERSGPATAIIVGNRAYLVDFGPGVVRRAAAAAAQGTPALEPPKITIAFVTHFHPDHTTGYPDLILTPWVMGRTQLDVYGPEGTEEMTKYVLQAWRRDIDIGTKGMERRKPLVVRPHDVKPGVVYKDDNVTVTAFAVSHGEWPLAFGYRFDTPGKSIVISGDTSPSDAVVAHCHPCDVLIHEAYSPSAMVATMLDWLAYRAKYHTSTDQLADIANRTKPGNLIIYHTSGRTPDEQLLREVRQTYHGKAVVGHDLEIY